MSGFRRLLFLADSGRAQTGTLPPGLPAISPGPDPEKLLEEGAGPWYVVVTSRIYTRHFHTGAWVPADGTWCYCLDSISNFLSLEIYDWLFPMNTYRHHTEVEAWGDDWYDFNRIETDMALGSSYEALYEWAVEELEPQGFHRWTTHG